MNTASKKPTRSPRKQTTQPVTEAATTKRSFPWFAAIVVLCLLAIFANLAKNSFMKNSVSQSAGRAVVASVTYEPVASQAATKSSTNQPIRTQVTAKASPTAVRQQVTKLADTAATTEVLVENGDNFWKISKRICGTGTYANAIKAANGYQNKTLKPGAYVNVACVE